MQFFTQVISAGIRFSGLLLLLLFFSCQREKPGAFSFPQGVASADPQPTAVLLWTRALPADTSLRSVGVQLELARDRGFQQLVQTESLIALASNDFTLRYLVEKLKPDNEYYYRFICGVDTSMVGRTFTAPADTTAASLAFATLACSSYEQGFYGTLKTMIEEDKARPAEEQIRMVFHLGDFIYEVVGDDPRNDNHHPKWLIDAQGKERAIAPFPQGIQRPDNGHWKSGSWNPVTVADYRHLYKTYISNPVMKEARARWPFVYTWDDHEFVDGNHQTSSYDYEVLGLPGLQALKVASNQAWFEYLPAVLSQGTTVADVKNPAYDFRPVEVQNAPLGETKENGLYTEPNNLKAINSMRMYRALQWGKDIVIVVPDTKSYQEPGGSVLGQEQKKWFKKVLRQSDARWKLWANSEPMLKVEIDYEKVAATNRKRELLYGDSWKSAATEREEILSFIKKNKITGVVALSGDYHIQMAGTVATADKTPVMADFAVTSMSAFADFFWLERKGKHSENEAVYQLFATKDKTGKLRPNINTTVLYGSRAALAMAAGKPIEAVKKLDNRSLNPGLSYFDCEHNGFLTGKINKVKLEATFVNTRNAREDFEQQGAPVVSRLHFLLPAWGSNNGPAMGMPRVEGELFPF